MSVPLLASGMGIVGADDLELQGPYWVATHLAAVVFMAMVVLLSCLLLVQYLVRYHKYQRTAGTEPISPCHSLGGSIGRCVLNFRKLFSGGKLMKFVLKVYTGS